MCCACGGSERAVLADIQVVQVAHTPVGRSSLLTTQWDGALLCMLNNGKFLGGKKS